MELGLRWWIETMEMNMVSSRARRSKSELELKGNEGNVILGLIIFSYDISTNAGQKQSRGLLVRIGDFEMN